MIHQIISAMNKNSIRQAVRINFFIVSDVKRLL